MVCHILLECIECAEDTIEKMDSSLKVNIKSNNKILTQNIQETSDTMKIPNLRIISIEEGKIQLKST